MNITPCDLSAERCVLGCLLLDNSISGKFFEDLNSDDFLSDQHKELFVISKELFLQSLPIDMVTLSKKIKESKTLQEKDIADFMMAVPSAIEFEKYSKILQDCSVQRRAFELGNSLSSNSDAMTPDEIIHSVSSFLNSNSSEKITAIDAEKASFDAFENIIKKINGDFRRIDTADILDEKLFGIAPTNFFVIGARPKTGKSAFAMNIALDSAKKGNKVLLCSLEMSSNEVWERIFAREGRIMNFALQVGKNIKEEDQLKIPKVVDELRKIPLMVSDFGNLTVGSLKVLIQEQKKKGGVDMVIVDYLQLMKGEGKNIYERVSKISQEMKQLAMDEDIAIIAMAQFNRGVEGRKEKKPMMSDFRDSGSIEQDANLIGALWTDEDDEDSDIPKKEQDICFSLLASRNSPTFTLPLTFEKDYQNFKQIK